MKQASVTISKVMAEVARQEAIHPDGYPPTRNGLRLGLAVAQDELDETLEEWSKAKCKCYTTDCDHADWIDLKMETVQAAAILLRIIDGLEESEQRDV